MENKQNRKICIVSFQNDVEDTHLLSLTNEQIDLLDWLRSRGFDITISVRNDIEII